MENKIIIDDQNRQKATENVIGKVIQKLKEQKIIIFVALLVILSLGSIFVSIYYRQKRIPTNQEKNTVESQKSDSVLNNTKESPFLEILDTKSKIPAELGEEPTAIAISGGIGCQPDFFDPQTSKYNRLEQTEKTGSYWAKDIYQIKENDHNYEFSIEIIPTPSHTITAYKFGCASSWDYVLDIRKDNKRTALYTHVNTFYLNSDKNYLFLDNFLKNKENKNEHKRRIITLDGTKKIDIQSIDCVSRWAKWDNGLLITYSDMNTDRSVDYTNNTTKICIWDTNGNLKHRLQGNLTWYGASSDSLWAEIGTLPKDPNIFYAYDNNFNSAPRMCSLFLQDLTDQKRNKVIDLFLEGSDDMPQHLCPWNPSVKFDFSQTTFDSPQLKFKLDAIYKDHKYYKKYLDWQTPPNQPLQSYILYKYYDYISFKYPSYLIKGGENTGGSSYSQEFKEENGQFTLTFLDKGNYNQISGKPYATIDEYVNMPYKVKTIIIDGQEGRQPLPRAGSENIFSATFFSKDLKSIYIIDLEVPKDDLKIVQGQKMFDQILSTFKFSDTR